MKQIESTSEKLTDEPSTDHNPRTSDPRKEKMMKKVVKTKKLKAKVLSLDSVWGIRMKLMAEADKLMAEGDKLWAKGDKLRTEADKLWTKSILEVHGNIKFEWKNCCGKKQSYECHLETGEVFVP